MKLFALSICGRITLNMHSLNNEGAEGNRSFSRQVSIVDDKGGVQTVNAVSGDMLKHIQAEHLHALLTQNGSSVPLCGSCRMFSANRISGDTEFDKVTSGKPAAGQVTREMLTRCAFDDMEGILITNNKLSVPRKSVVEFGWLVGLPESTRTASFFHAKYVAERGSGSGDEANLGQNIFHRDASSGVYASVVNLELARIGFNHVTRHYDVDREDRAARLRALLCSLMFTFVEPGGAMRATQNPHVVDFSGALMLSKKAVPAPTISALNPAYLDQLEGITKSINELEADAVEVRPFQSMEGFSQRMSAVVREAEPWAA